MRFFISSVTSRGSLFDTTNKNTVTECVNFFRANPHHQEQIRLNFLFAGKADLRDVLKTPQDLITLAIEVFPNDVSRLFSHLNEVGFFDKDNFFPKFDLSSFIENFGKELRSRFTDLALPIFIINWEGALDSSTAKSLTSLLTLLSYHATLAAKIQSDHPESPSIPSANTQEALLREFVRSFARQQALLLAERGRNILGPEAAGDLRFVMHRPSI